LNLWSDGMVEFLKVGGMGFESLVFGDGWLGGLELGLLGGEGLL
jgi:hypothetical protein